MNKLVSHNFVVDEVITRKMVFNDSQNNPRGGTGVLSQEYFEL